MGLSKIKTVQPNGTYQSKFDNSTMYVFDISLEDIEQGMYKISLVDKPAIEENFIYFNEVKKIEMFSNGLPNNFGNNLINFDWNIMVSGRQFLLCKTLCDI